MFQYFKGQYEACPCLYGFLSQNCRLSELSVIITNKVWYIICCRMGKVSVTHLATGDYEVQDVKCAKCSAHLGWTYLKAFNEVIVASSGLAMCTFDGCTDKCPLLAFS